MLEAFLINKNWTAAREWIEKHGVSGRFDGFQHTCLGYAVFRQAPLWLVKFIWSKDPLGIDVGPLICAQGSRPLMLSHFPSVTQFLLEKGADPITPDSSGYTPLLVFIKRKHHSYRDEQLYRNVMLLLQYGATPYIVHPSYNEIGVNTVFEYINRKLGLGYKRGIILRDLMAHTWTLLLLTQGRRPDKSPHLHRIPVDILRMLRSYLVSL